MSTFMFNWESNGVSKALKLINQEKEGLEFIDIKHKYKIWVNSDYMELMENDRETDLMSFPHIKSKKWTSYKTIFSLNEKWPYVLALHFLS